MVRTQRIDENLWNQSTTKEAVNRKAGRTDGTVVSYHIEQNRRAMALLHHISYNLI